MSDSLNRSEGKNMKIERFVLGPIETNCYVVVNEDTKECFAVDMAYCPEEYVCGSYQGAGISDEGTVPDPWTF